MGVVSNRITVCYFPLPLIPSRQGRGKFTFYEVVNFGNKQISKREILFVRLGERLTFVSGESLLDALLRER